jgi:hypothetical protein
MALPNLIVSAAAEWNGKALSKGSNQIKGFEKTVKNLGRTLGVTFSAAALLSYSKKAVAAYGEQIAEAKRLDTALRNLGFNFATAEAEGYIDAIEKATGVNRDVLQPSFIQLAQVTRSTTIAQSMLNTALDVSAGTGMDLVSATKILSQAYVGNLKGLRQLNLGLTQAELAGKSYLEIEKLIATQYAGQSKNAADSYAGSIARLKIAAEQASEQIGGALVTSLGTSAGGMDKLIDKVDGAADSISGLITNTAYLAKELGNLFSSIPGAGVLEDAGRALKNYLGRFSIGALRRNVDIVLGRQGGFPQGLPADLKNFQNQTEKTKMDKEALKRQKELIALQKKAQLAEKNKLSLSKAAAVFDTTRISLAAALKATYDKETRLRLEALIAIEEDNGDLALRKIGELAALQKNADLAKLAGIKEISDATLLSINTQLLNELTAIDKSKMAESDKEIAREEAFKKYNAAITAAGQLASAEQYSERVQIQLTEIARLAAISRTTSASNTATLLRESAELSMIDRVAKAQKAADDARLKSLQDYIAQLNRMPTVGGLGGGPTGGGPTGGGPTGGGPTGGGPTGNKPLGGKTAFELEQEAALKKFFEAELARRAAEKAAADAAAKAAVEALQGVGRGITEIGIVGEKIDFIPKAEATAANIAAILEYADAATARANAIATLLESSNMRDMEILTAQALGNPQYGFQSFQSAEAKALVATGNGSVGGGIGAFDRDINITVNTGVGDPEAIARAIEDLLNQSGYRGTTTNRGSGNYLVS